MRRLVPTTSIALLSIACACGLAACAAGAGADPELGPPAGAAARSLRPFGSEEAFDEYRREMIRDWQERSRRNPPLAPAQNPREPTPFGYPPPAGEPVDAADPAPVHAGGIVKLAGDYLVILRSDTLYTVRIGGGELRAVAAAELAGAEAGVVPATPRELLVRGDVVAAVHHRGGWRQIDVQLFRLDSAGGLAPRATWELRTAVARGEETSRNSVRLVGGKLVFYTPLTYDIQQMKLVTTFPAVRRAGDAEWLELSDGARIYRPAGPLLVENQPTVHAVTVCDLAGEAPDCRSTALFAPAVHVRHFSPTAVYVWARGAVRLYRIPLDGSPPAALAAGGWAQDEHSFLETPDGTLRVLVRGRSPTGGGTELLTAPPGSFGDGTGHSGPESYRELPHPGTTSTHNRFVGDWLLYASAPWEWEKRRAPATVYATRWAGGEVFEVPVPHGLRGFRPFGSDALVSAAGRDSLHVYPLRLGDRPELGEGFARRPRSADDEHAEALFHLPAGGDRLAGLALSSFGPATAALFLRDDGRGLREMGDVRASPRPGEGCPVCGEFAFARPFAVGGRIFALVRDELVEVALEGGRVRELRRVRLSGVPGFEAPER